MDARWQRRVSLTYAARRRLARRWAFTQVMGVVILAAAAVAAMLTAHQTQSSSSHQTQSSASHQTQSSAAVAMVACAYDHCAAQSPLFSTLRLGMAPCLLNLVFATEALT